MTKDTRHDYQQWTKSHEGIKKHLAKEGHEYVRHAKNLLPLLEGFAELHPIAKAVVVTFKAVVMYEETRVENDSRVAILFVSQTEMMHALLNVNHQLQERRAGQIETYSDYELEDLLHQVREEIGACGNSMDTYHKATRVAKFFKSQEWKTKILDHATNFDRFRSSLQQILSLQIASDIGKLRQKMDTILSRLFTPKEVWEKKLFAKIPKGSRNSQHLIEIDDKTFQMYVEITEDPLFNFGTAIGDNFKVKAGFKDDLRSQAEQLKKEILVSLEVLCKRNQETFDLRLEYHSRQLQETVQNSAQYVIRSLSGPYDRLQNGDLKALWKEMNWIFCVDNSHFTSALFEYYRDHFSSGRDGPQAVEIHEESHKNLLSMKEVEAEMKKENLTEVTTLTRMGVLDHVDAWTLDPIIRHGDRITSAIDCDRSGFIRISEINAFTEQMPEGWSLPQWCAYAALGEAYETRIYRRRIHNVLARMMEIQEKVHPLNRIIISVTANRIVPFFQRLAWVPTASYDAEPIAPMELRSLIHDKIKRQDDTWRRKLASLKWAIEDEATLKMLYGDETLEKYVLQLSLLLLENTYNVMQACSHVTVDVREIRHITSPLLFLQGMCMKRIKSLRTQSDLKTFSGGIWYAIDVGNPDEKEGAPEIPFQIIDVPRFLADEVIILHEFPLRPLDQPPQTCLKYKTWEEYIQSIPENKIPNKIPYSWNAETEDGDNTSDNESDDDGSRAEARVSYYRLCDKCGKSLIRGYYYGCTRCKDFDLCSGCWQLPAEEHTVEHLEHKFAHPMLRFALDTFPIQRDWLSLEARFAMTENQDMSNLGLTYQDDITMNTHFLCNKCEKPISLDHETPFYKCMNHSCHDYFLCKDCDSRIHEQIGNEDINGHYWWHSMLVLHRHRVVEDHALSCVISQDQSKFSEGTDQGSDSVAIISRISEVEAKLDTTNAMLQDAANSSEHKAQAQEIRISQLEAKVDGLAMELRNFLELLAQRSGIHAIPPNPQISSYIEYDDVPATRRRTFRRRQIRRK